MCCVSYTVRLRVPPGGDWGLGTGDYWGEGEERGRHVRVYVPSPVHSMTEDSRLTALDILSI